MPPAPRNQPKSLFVITGIALGIVLLLVYFAPYGLRNYLLLREQLNQVSSELDELTTKNQELTDEITLLKNDANYVEKIARQKLKMLKKNEIIFEIPEKKSKGE